MNNAKNILLIAAITSLLVMGTSIIPMQSYAGENKNTKDSKSSIKASTEVDKKSAGQKLDQDNFCYRGDDCEQANQGQQLAGKDNDAKGFNDQSKNIQQSVTPTPNQPPTQPPTPPEPTSATLNVCKEVVNPEPFSLQPSDFRFVFTTLANPNTFQGANEGCTAVTVAPGTYTFTEIAPQGVRAHLTAIEGDCLFDVEDNSKIVGTIAAGETQTCSITNTILE
jgi:hypothetical protein